MTHSSAGASKSESGLVSRPLELQCLKDLEQGDSHRLAKDGWRFLGVGDHESRCLSRVLSWNHIPRLHSAIWAAFPELKIIPDLPGWTFERYSDSESPQMVVEYSDGSRQAFGCTGIAYFMMPDGRRRIINLRHLGKPTVEFQLWGSTSHETWLEREFQQISGWIGPEQGPAREST